MTKNDFARAMCLPNSRRVCLSVRLRSAVFFLALTALGSAHRNSHAEAFNYGFNLYDQVADSPYYVSNAFIRRENFYGPDSVRYWQVASPGWGEMVYRIDTPRKIETATIYAPLVGYNSFDSQARGFLDVSTDSTTWSQVGATPLTSTGPEYFWGETVDISGIVHGSTAVYVRARLYGSWSSTGGSFGVPQWLRTGDYVTDVFQFNSTLQPIPEPSTYALTLAGLAFGGFSMWRRRKRVARPIELLVKMNMASSRPRCVNAGYAPAISLSASRLCASVLAAVIVAAVASGTSMGNGVPVLTPFPIDGPDSRAYGVSGDGSVIVGQYGFPATDPASKSFRWTLAGSVEFLSTLPDYSSAQAWRVSDNGAVIAGRSYNGLFETNRAVRWTAAGPQNLGILSGSDTNSYAWGLSGDGAVVVGQSTGDGVSSSRAFRWTESSGMQSLGSLSPDLASLARAASGDGSVIVGQADVATGISVAFRWTEASGMTALPNPSWVTSSAYGTAVSANGSYAAGYAYEGTTAKAVLWMPSGESVDLGGQLAIPWAVSSDGALIVGSDLSWSRAFVWRPTTGIVWLYDYLQNLGADLTGWSNLSQANDMSDDGTTIVGVGTYLGATRAFVVTAVPEPSTYAMALAGLACGGFSMWRRRKRQPFVGSLAA